jgi:small-conductance mechanosensitive channel
MQSMKIVLTCVVASMFYGILHDQFTAHICVEYFSVFHPPVFPTESPTLLALGWGVIATWWMGAFLGVLLALASRAGSRRKVDPADLIRPISKLLSIMGLLAVFAGVLGYVLARSGAIAPPGWAAAALSPARHARFMADWWAHSASYFVGFFGGIALCIVTFRKRLSPAH